MKAIHTCDKFIKQIIHLQIQKGKIQTNPIYFLYWGQRSELVTGRTNGDFLINNAKGAQS